MPENPTRNSRWKRIFLRTLVSFLGIAFIFFLVVSLKGGGIKGEISRIQSERLPVTLVELNDYYPAVPDSDNAALRLVNLIPQLNSGENIDQETLPILGYADIISRTNLLSEAMRHTVNELLTSNAEVLAEIELALQLPESRYPIDLTQGYNVMLSHLSGSKHTAQHLRLQAVWHLDQGNYHEALNSMEATFRLGLTLKDEPLVISQLVAIAITAINLHTMEYLFSNAELSNEELKHLILYTDESLIHRGMVRALIGERTIALAMMQDPDGKDGRLFYSIAAPFRWRNSAGQWLLRKSGSLTGDYIFYLESIDQEIKILEEFPKYPMQTHGVIHEKFEGIKSTYLFSGVMRRELNEIPYKLAKIYTRLREVRIAIAVEQYRRDHNEQPPETLGDLVPDYLDEIPLDPFANEEMKYIIRDTEYVIYSVGDDGVDDEGVPMNSGNNRSYDIPFTVAR